jgi:DNA-binding MarR family transcriptional regulator
MVAMSSGGRLTEIAQDLFEVVTQLCLATPRGRRRPGDLKEIEFFALSLLHDHKTMIVGDMQRQLGVLPAQMSRVIRSLENRSLPLISCQINPQDKRKINVCLTEAGEKAVADYEAAHVRRIADLLRDLSDEDQDDLVRLLDRVRILVERGPLSATT